MGKDGLDGARDVRAAGGRVLVEAESTCTVYGMPRAVAEAGLADAVLPLDELPAAIAQEAGMTAHALAPPATTTRAFCEGVRRLCGIDLLQYKRGQMERRVRTFAERRGAASLADYRDLLRRDPDELDAFLDRVTINVSQLWRNPEQWTRCASEVLPELAAAPAASAPGAPAAPTAPRPTRSPPSATRPSRRRASDHRHRHRPPHGRARPRRPLLRRGRPHARRPRCCSATSSRRRRRLARQPRAARDGPLRGRRPAAPARRARPYDLVLCRNTVIYFTEEVRDALHARLVEALRPGGYLVVGATERVADPRGARPDPPHPFIYRKS